MADPNPPAIVLAGRLQREFILPASAPPLLNSLGGNLTYAAGGMALWGGHAGLIARVAPDWPHAWTAQLEAWGFDCRGLRPMPDNCDSSYFVCFDEQGRAQLDNALIHFAERKLPFPSEFLQTATPSINPCSKTDYQSFSFRVNDMPSPFLDASAAHICPIDFLSHRILPSVLKQGLIQNLSMRACSCYMDPRFWEEIRPLIADVNIFMTNESQALKLFQGRSRELLTIAESLADYGPEIVLIQGADGTKIYDRPGKHHWLIPPYPARVADPTGMSDSFDGAFIHNYRQSYDAVEAALHGAIAASFCGEGSGPAYLLGSLPGLKEARLQSLRQNLTAL